MSVRLTTCRPQQLRGTANLLNMHTCSNPAQFLLNAAFKRGATRLAPGRGVDMSIGKRPLLAAGLLYAGAVALLGSMFAHASLVGSGDNDTSDGSFRLTTITLPFLVSNPVGPLEFRSSVEFDLRDVLITDTITDVRFTVQGAVQTETDLSIYPADLDIGNLFVTTHLAPSAVVRGLKINITDFSTELGSASYPRVVGIDDLRESESNGGMIAVEYLFIVATIATLGGITTTMLGLRASASRGAPS